MRALIIPLAAAGFTLCSVSGYAGDELSRARLEQPGRTADEEPTLKSAGASTKAVHAIDEDAPLKSTGRTARPSSRAAADDEEPLKSAGSSRKAGRAIDDDPPLKSSSVPTRAGRAIDDDASLKSAGASSKAERSLDEDALRKYFRTASRPGPGTPQEQASRIDRKR